MNTPQDKEQHNTEPEPTPSEQTVTDGDTVRVEVFYTTEKKLGHWTEARRIEVRARQSSLQLDLRSHRIPEGEIVVHLHAERSTVKLLVPDEAVVDETELELPDRSKVKDAQRHAPADGRRIRLTGRLQHSEIRITRGGMANLTTMFTREFVEEAQRAHRDGDHPALPDPSLPGPRPKDIA
ncbi:hypothetical protein ADL01_02645 [Streptomyces sp. NRRL WC-3618]|uniref:hypothetical protein n=1 Tax=unclassified Streptomyces TaxID=2593676 RepID=UPI0006AE4D0F|nr:hypothetical protein [Streptomyces sp. NRRL WC-3618]KOV88137.1 hypothetical protein ADL01_02645 [Streptomyces sp. NRRL WC-3618]